METLKLENEVLVDKNKNPFTGWAYKLVTNDLEGNETVLSYFEKEEDAEKCLADMGYEGDVKSVYFQQGKPIIKKINSNGK